MAKNPQRPRDTNQLAKFVVDAATAAEGESSAFRRAGDASQDHDPKDPAAVALGRRGGLKGGLARALGLSPERRKQIAQQAAKARWQKK